MHSTRDVLLSLSLCVLAFISCDTFILTADASFTMANILSMTEGVQDHEGLGVLLGIRDPKTKFEKIRQSYKSAKEQKEALLRLWYTTHPLASWSLLHQALNMIGDIRAAKSVQEQFLGGEVTHSL